jgi:hypothetical protein
MKKKSLFMLLALCAAIGVAMPTYDADAQRKKKKAVVEETPTISPEEMEALKKPFRDSLLFSDAEVELVRAAAAGRQTGTAILEKDKVELIPIDRKIKLHGIYYATDNNWIVWLNGYKLVPGRLLPEIMEIKVNRDQVFLRWYDIGLDGVIDLTLRPNQIYDIVTGIVYNDTAGGTGASGDTRGRRGRAK